MAAGLTIALAVFCASGCSGEKAPSGTSAGKTKLKIALIMKSLANEFFSTMADGAESHQAEHADDYDLVINGLKDERDLARQVGLVEEMVAAGVDAIVIAPADSKALVPALKKAQNAGVVVVNIDNKLDDGVLSETGTAIPFVGPDNRHGARLAGEFLAAKLQPGDPVAILEGIPTAFNAQQRKLGFEDAMQAAGMKIVASQSGQWETGIANNVASAILSEHPEVKALLCSNDNMAFGARAAVKAAGRLGDVQVIGFDNISAVQTAIRDGSILATVDQHADQLAVFGIEAAIEALRTDSAPDDRLTPVDLITAEMLKP